MVAKLTLDTNCLIDIAESRPAAMHVCELIRRCREGEIDVAIVASSASERQVDHSYLATYETFQKRLSQHGVADLRVLLPLARFGIGFWNKMVFASEEATARERIIYETLFPTSPYLWPAFARARSSDERDQSTPAYTRWRNQILDAQAYWAHEHDNRDIFVTSDKRFRALQGKAAFPKAQISSPEEATAGC